MAKPFQAPALFAGIPDTTSFGREIDVQPGVPMDGSNQAGRTYSPFLIRVVLPSILGNNGNDTLTNTPPTRTPAGSTVRSDNRDATSYAQGQSSAQQSPSGQTAYKSMVASGGGLPGLTLASELTLEDAYNQAMFNQVFGPPVANAATPASNSRNNAVVPAWTNDITALSLAVQLKQLSTLPPLLLLINPTSMQTSYTKVAQHQNRRRKGFIYEAWGEEMAKISFTFKIGAYIAGLANSSQLGSVVTGVQRASREDSAAGQQLQNLLAMYQGGTYLQDTLTNTRAFPMVGNLAIEYDQNVYVGHMENFNFTEDEQHQNGGLEITIEFTANKVFDLADSPSSIVPMQAPSNPRNTNQGALSRTGTGSSVSFFSAPSIGGSSPIAAQANQAWQAAVAPTSAPGASVSVLSTRRT